LETAEERTNFAKVSLRSRK